jgi:hypothetical protein
MVLGIQRPQGFPFNLNNAVDTLLKREFDMHREHKTAHPYMELFGLNLIPYQHPQLQAWRSNPWGIRVLMPNLNLELFGAIDDLWEDPSTGDIHVVDYKATSKSGEVSLSAEWQLTYKRQIEFYQWLLRHQNIPVSPLAWFVYLNGKRDAETFDSKLTFKVSLLPYSGETEWVEPALNKIKETLDLPSPPHPPVDCEYCQYAYRAAAA